MNFQVYGLVDSEKIDEFRYIGATCEPEKRLAHHFWEACNGNLSSKNVWIREVLKSKRQIILKIIETFNNLEEAIDAECYYIYLAIEKGHRLTNYAHNPCRIPRQQGELDFLLKILQFEEQYKVQLQQELEADKNGILYYEKLAEYLTVRQAAYWLQLSKDDVYRLIDGGFLPFVQLGPRTRRIAKMDVRELREALKYFFGEQNNYSALQKWKAIKSVAETTTYLSQFQALVNNSSLSIVTPSV
jgi:excisionase family DNA binding protein